MKNYALSPLIENLIMLTSQNVQINVMYLVENCLSYNISKSGRKSMTGKRDNEGHYDVINENFDARACARCDAH